MRKRERMTRAALLLSVMALSACGYHIVGGTGHNIPSTVQSIAVPTFRNETSGFKVEQTLTAAIVRELMTRTRYQIVASDSANETDVVLNGAITGFSSNPSVYDPRSNRATTAQINVRMKVSLVERKTGKILYENADLVYRERYEISGQASHYFDESTAGTERLSRSLASTVVAGILSGF